MARAAIIKFWRANHAEIDFTANDFDAAHQVMAVAQMLHRHEIGNFGDAAFAQKSREQNVRVRKIALAVFEFAGRRAKFENVRRVW